MWPNLIGIDSPLVAVSWQWLFARAFAVEIPVLFHLILGLCVWWIYLADRLLDSIRAGNVAAATSRLRFTKRNFGKFLGASVLIGLADGYLILRNFPWELIRNGLAVSGLLALYYLFRFRSKGRLAGLIPREILCGTVFAMGCGLIVFTLGSRALPYLHFLPAVGLFALICSTSCILISIWERNADLANRDHSIAMDYPRLRPVLDFALNLLIILSACMIFLSDWQIHFSIGIAATALRILLHFEASLSPNILRVLADGVLLSPLLVVFFS